MVRVTCERYAMMNSNRRIAQFTSAVSALSVDVIAGLLLLIPLLLLTVTAAGAQPTAAPPASSAGPFIGPSVGSSIRLLNPPLYIIDSLETHSRFEVMFLGFMRVRGKFERTTGTLHHDPARIDEQGRANDAITAIIDSTTLSANVVNANATNKVLRGPEFFNVEKFPAIIFKSSRFLWNSDRLTGIDGTLTLLDMTRPVTLTVQKSGCTPTGTVKRARCTADAFLKVNRSDFGMKAWSASVSDEVKIIVELVAYLAVTEAAVEAKSETKPETKKTDEIKAPSTSPLAQ